MLTRTRVRENRGVGLAVGHREGVGRFSLSFFGKIKFFPDFDGRGGVVQGGGVEWRFEVRKNFKNSVEIQRKGLLYGKNRVN